MKEEINTLSRRLLYLGVGNILFLLAALIGVMFKLPYTTSFSSFIVVVIICFLVPPVLWPTILRLGYIAFTEIEDSRREDRFDSDLLNGHSTFRSKELDDLKKKYDSPQSTIINKLQ